MPCPNRQWSRNIQTLSLSWNIKFLMYTAAIIIIMTLLSVDTDKDFKLEFRSVGFSGGRKPGESGEKLLEQGKNQQQTQPT